MKIRRAITADSEEIGALIVKLAAEFITHEFGPGARKYFLTSNDGASVKRFMESGFTYHVAESGNRVVGVVGVKNPSHLYHLFVGVSHQGKGLGRRLWEVAMADCLQNGPIEVFTVNSSNNAVNFYERLGFVQTKAMQNKEGVLFIPMKLRVGR